jgi:hypothetical protein
LQAVNFAGVFSPPAQDLGKRYPLDTQMQSLWLPAIQAQLADADAARVRALAAYKDFLTLWKDADPDIPILKEAKAEYAKLQ